MPCGMRILRWDRKGRRMIQHENAWIGEARCQKCGKLTDHQFVILPEHYRKYCLVCEDISFKPRMDVANLPEIKFIFSVEHPKKKFDPFLLKIICIILTSIAIGVCLGMYINGGMK